MVLLASNQSTRIIASIASRSSPKRDGTLAGASSAYEW